jgi:hypothetical protein
MPSFTGETRGRGRAYGARLIDLPLLAASMALAACTTSTQDDLTNPPPGPAASCAPISALSGCVAGALSFSCTSDRPDDGDTNLVCDRGRPGAQRPHARAPPSA